MADIPAAAVHAAAEAMLDGHDCEHLRTDPYMERCFPCDARAALEAALPHLGLPARRPRIVCPVCTREVVRRDDGNPSSHPTRDQAAVCEHGHCRGGCRGCRP